MVLDLLGEGGGEEYAAGSGMAFGSGGSIEIPAEFKCPAKRLERD